MIRKLSLLLLLIGLYACKSDPYQVDLDSAKHHVSYQNLDSSFRYAHVDEQRRLIKALLVSDFDLSQFCFPYALQVSTQSDSAFVNGLQRTYSHPFNKQVCSALDKRYKWRQQTFLESCLGHLKISSRGIQAGLVRYRDPFV
jgi:hypothetical protein